MKASDLTADTLAAAGVRDIYVLPGGMISHLLDSIHSHPGLRLLTMRHEQAAGFAADAVGRLTGRPGVAMGTVGPGAINLLSAIATCYFDSVPAVFITGQVQTYLRRAGRSCRQSGFQECDFLEMVRPVCKAAWMATRPEEIPLLIQRALSESVSGRPGPIVVEAPFDLQSGEVGDGELRTLEDSDNDGQEVSSEDVAMVADMLNAASRPLLLLGGGTRSPRARLACRELADVAGVPVVASLMALDILPHDHPRRAGFIGVYGNRWANLALAASDIVVAIGSRLDPGVTSADTAAWQKGRRIVRIDRDRDELSCRFRNAITFVGDAGTFATSLSKRLGLIPMPDRRDWLAMVRRLERDSPAEAELRGCDGINPNEFIMALSLRSKHARAYLVDSGQHTWWTAQSLRVTEGQRFLAASGLGAMGYALPAAIGASQALGGSVVAIVGDGSLQINVQELETVAQLGAAIKIIVLDNACHGMVREFQEEAFDGRYPTTVLGYSAPDFVEVAEAFGIRARALQDAEHMGSALEWLWEHPDAPSLLRVAIAQTTNVYPSVPFGSSLTDMRRWPGATS